MNGSVEIPDFTAGRGGVIVVGSVTVDVTAFSTRLPLRGARHYRWQHDI